MILGKWLVLSEPQFLYMIKEGIVKMLTSLGSFDFGPAELIKR